MGIQLSKQKKNKKINPYLHGNAYKGMYVIYKFSSNFNFLKKKLLGYHSM